MNKEFTGLDEDGIGPTERARIELRGFDHGKLAAVFRGEIPPVYAGESRTPR